MSILYIFNQFSIQKAQQDIEIDLTDWPYQQQLPYHARSTAAKSIKNNIRSTEMLTDPNMRLTASKVETIIASHVDHRRDERNDDPERFNVRKTLAERCVQMPVPDARKSSSETFDYYSGNQDSKFKLYLLNLVHD